MDSRLFSLVKTVSWYFSDLILTFFIAFAITKDVQQAVAIGLLQQTWELGLYYFHERVWVKIKSRRQIND